MAAIPVTLLQVGELKREPATHIKLVARHGRLTLTTDSPADRDTPRLINEPSWIYYTCRADVTEEGTALVPAHQFLEFARGLEPGSVELSLDEGEHAFSATAGKHYVSLPTAPFVLRPYSAALGKHLSGIGLKTGESFAVNQRIFREALRRSIHAGSDHIPFRFKGGRLYVGDSLMEVSSLSDRREEVCVNIADVIASILLKQLEHDVDVTIVIYKLLQFSVCFEAGKVPYIFHWNSLP
jgi:hypothetical protein